MRPIANCSARPKLACTANHSRRETPVSSASPHSPVLGRIGRQLLVAFVVLSLLPVAATNMTGYLTSRASYRALVLENIGKTAVVQAYGLEDFLSAQKGLLTGAADGIMPVVGSVSGRDGPEEQAEGVANLGSSLQQTVARSAHLEALAVQGPDGELVMSTEPGWPSDPGVCSLLDGGARFARARGTEEEALQIVIAVPVGPSGDERPSTLCGRFTFAIHRELLAERAANYVSGMVYVTDDKGEVVCGSFHHDEPHVHPGHHLPPEFAAIATTGRPWTGVLDDPDGASGGASDDAADGAAHAGGHDASPTFAAFAPASGLPWGILVEVPASQALAPLEQLKHRALLFGALLAVAMVAFVTVLARRLVRPLHDLVGAASRIARGRYGETVPVQGDSELSVLATEFNRMSLALSDSYERLDARVAERTRELAVSRDFVDLILDSVEHRIVVLDPELHVIKANHAAKEAYGTTLGQRCGSLLQCGPTPCADCPAALALRTGRLCRREKGTVGAGLGEVVAVECFPVPTQQGAPSAVIEVMRVITDDKRLQATMLHQEKMSAFGQLAAGFAHEIGNPLSCISSELQMMQLEAGEGGGPQAASLVVLRQQVDRVSRLLRQLTDFGRRDRDEATAVSLAEVAQDVLRLVEHDPRSRGVALRVQADAQAPPVWSSPDPLIQVLLNLCLNALDALAGLAEPALTISVQGCADRVEVAIQDNGPGVPDAVRERIFEPFFTTKPPGQGTGLGLFVSRQIIADLGGELTAAWPRQGGTRFSLVLPAFRPEAHDKEPTDA